MPVLQNSISDSSTPMANNNFRLTINFVSYIILFINIKERIKDMKLEDLFDKIDALRLNKEAKYELKSAIENVINSCCAEALRKQQEKLEQQIESLKQPSESFLAQLETAIAKHPEFITGIIDNRIEQGLSVRSEYVMDVDDGHEEISLSYFGREL